MTGPLKKEEFARGITPAPNVLRVGDVMSKKVVTIGIAGSAFEAARKIMDHEIGCVVVTYKEGGGRVAGIVTKGDILREVVMKRVEPENTRAGAIMSKSVITISADSSLDEASDAMSRHNVSKLPVLGKDDALIGIVTSTDLMRKGRPRSVSSQDKI